MKSFLQTAKRWCYRQISWWTVDHTEVSFLFLFFFSAWTEALTSVKRISFLTPGLCGRNSSCSAIVSTPSNLQWGRVQLKCKSRYDTLQFYRYTKWARPTRHPWRVRSTSGAPFWLQRLWLERLWGYTSAGLMKPSFDFNWLEVKEKNVSLG